MYYNDIANNKSAINIILISNSFLIHISHSSSQNADFRNISIVESGLKEADPIVADEVNDTVLLGQPARPYIRAEVLEWLGFAQALKGIPACIINNI